MTPTPTRKCGDGAPGGSESKQARKDRSSWSQRSNAHCAAHKRWPREQRWYRALRFGPLLCRTSCRLRLSAHGRPYSAQTFAAGQMNLRQLKNPLRPVSLFGESRVSCSKLMVAGRYNYTTASPAASLAASPQSTAQNYCFPRNSFGVWLPRLRPNQARGSPRLIFTVSQGKGRDARRVELV